MTIDEILRQNIQNLYTVDGIDEINEAILTLYKIIGLAFQHEADSLVLTTSYICWEREGKRLGEYPITLEPDNGYDGQLDFMLARDPVLRAHIKKVSKVIVRPLYYKVSRWKYPHQG